MSKVLFCIFTCNRFFYFKNCLDSIREFEDQNEIDILVCDNCSIETVYSDYLQEMSMVDNIKVKRFSDRTRGELYRAMNYAVKYAKKKGYEFINFVQDDYQYLYKRDSSIPEIIDLFNNNARIVQVNNNLAWKRKADRMGSLLHLQSKGTNYVILSDKRPCDNGFTRVAAYDRLGEYPVEAISWGEGKDRYKNKLNGEVWFGRSCHKLKWSRAVTLMPNVTMMMDCAFVRGGVRRGRYFEPPEKYYIKPLEESQIEKISSRAKKKKFSFIEDRGKPWGWKPETLGKHSESNSEVIVDPDFK